MAAISFSMPNLCVLSGAAVYERAGVQRVLEVE